MCVQAERPRKKDVGGCVAMCEGQGGMGKRALASKQKGEVGAVCVNKERQTGILTQATCDFPAGLSIDFACGKTSRESQQWQPCDFKMLQTFSSAS